MKNHKKTPASKLLTRFDNELKAILMSDLNNNKTVRQQLIHSNQQVRLQMR